MISGRIITRFPRLGVLMVPNLATARLPIAFLPGKRRIKELLQTERWSRRPVRGRLGEAGRGATTALTAPIRPLPGIWDSLHVDTAVTLPIGVEALPRSRCTPG